MIRNYLVVALRNLARNKSFTIINVVGLSIGITCCIVIYLIIKYDYTFDQFHSQYNQIYKVVRDSKNASGVEHSDVTPYPFAKAFRNDFSDIPLVTQFHVEEQTLVKADDRQRNIR
jgi:putative ABC transport system permease protein